MTKSSVKGRNAGGANNVCVPKNFVFSLNFELFKKPFFSVRELGNFFPLQPELLELAKLIMAEMLDLFVKRNVIHP